VYLEGKKPEIGRVKLYLEGQKAATARQTWTGEVYIHTYIDMLNFVESEGRANWYRIAIVAEPTFSMEA
jgi:hypothetical protein